MTEGDSTTLAEKMKLEGERAKTSAATAIDGLAQVAEQLALAETSTALRRTGGQLRSDTFNLIVMGRFKNGKSTLLNALLGGTTHPVELNGAKGPMVVDDLPATATLTGVRYADEPYVKAWGFDGKAEPWSFPRYLQESALGNDDEENELRFKAIREFEMGYPARLCQAGVTVYDAPGLDEHDLRTAITREASGRCDAAIVVYRSDVLMGKGELVSESEVVADGTRVFTVVNLWDQRELDERLKGFVWNRYVHDHQGGPKWANQDFASRDIYFVNADKARAGRYGGDAELLAASGLLEFEQRLAEFLLRDRQHVHLQKFATIANRLAESIEQHVEQRRLAARADQAALRDAHQAIMPKLAAIRSRPAKLPPIFSRYGKDAERDLTLSFTAMVNRIRRELPTHLAATSLPSGEKFTKVLQAKKLQAEAAKVASDFVTSCVERWNRSEVPVVLGPLLERLSGEISDEIADISRDLAAAHLELTGWRVEVGTAGPLVGTAERVLSALAGLLFGDVVGALTGGAGGWRGAAGSIGGGFGSAFLLGALGVTSATVLFPAVLAGALAFGLLGGGHGLEQRVKDKCAQEVDKLLAGIPAEAGPRITAQLAQQFAAMQEEVMADIVAGIAEEERNIEALVELNQRSQADRERALVALDQSVAELGRQRLALQQALTLARQTA